MTFKVLDGDQRPAKIDPGAEILAENGFLALGSATQIRKHAVIDCARSGTISIGARTVIFPYAMILSYGGSITIGENCTVNPFCVLYGHGRGLIIGNNVRIATHTVIIPANHVFDDPGSPITEQGLVSKGISIGDDVWIGAGCRILDGVTIGNGAVLAAGAVVHRDVKEFTVVGGVPAVEIGRRG